MTAETTTTAVRREAPGILKRTSGYTATVDALVRKPGHNIRFDFGEIEELAKSIKANGMLHAIRVRRLAKPMMLAPVEGQKDVYELVEDPKATAHFMIIDGERRYEALVFLKKHGYELPDGIDIKIVDKNQSSMEDLFQMFEANGNKPLLPLEEAEGYRRMREGFPEENIKGLTIKQICERVGRKQVHVVATLALIDADDSVKAAVKSGSINSTTAKNIAVHARGNKAKQRELAEQAKAAGKDKGKKAALKKAIDDERRQKAAKKGQTLKMRALSDDELNKLGQKLAASLADRMRDAGMPLDADIRAYVVKDDKLALAATFGALEALKAAAGVKVNLEY
jgi:ParB-like chromosome segregation protein Spo0J